MDEIKELIKEVLEKGHLMSLATVDESGPWVSDLIFSFDDEFNLYWVSHEETRHSSAISKDPRVSASITISNNKGEKNIGIQLEGKAEKISNPPNKQAAAEGKSWYKFIPSKIELIYEPKFGFNKKKLPLH